MAGLAHRSGDLSALCALCRRACSEAVEVGTYEADSPTTIPMRAGSSRTSRACCSALSAQPACDKVVPVELDRFPSIPERYLKASAVIVHATVRDNADRVAFGHERIATIPAGRGNGGECQNSLFHSRWPRVVQFHAEYALDPSNSSKPPTISDCIGRYFRQTPPRLSSHFRDRYPTM